MSAAGAAARPFARVGVLGAGAWGTARAQLCARNGAEAVLWARAPAHAADIRKSRENRRRLPGVALDDRVAATSDMADLAAADALLLATPAQSLAQTLALVAASCGTADRSWTAAVCAKGFERGTGRLQTEILADALPNAREAVLSGPSFAVDVARDAPTAVTLACADPETAPRWIATLGGGAFRPYLSDDLVGAQVGGAAKNVVAIAAGVVVGRGLGDSARAATIARGFAEMRRLGLALGARGETLAGLSGLGDLVLTATSAQSRNFSLGLRYGRGEAIGDAPLAEGAKSAATMASLAARHGVETPIGDAVAALVDERTSVDEAIDALMARPLKDEEA
ncbi:MAG: NAD(P)H-dependent glycerol-3-phosphate dehydrogenase [Parvularculaceae bacterium]